MLIDYYYIKNDYKIIDKDNKIINNSLNIYYINKNCCRLMINKKERLSFLLSIYSLDKFYNEIIEIEYINEYIDINTNTIKLDYYNNIIPRYICKRAISLIKNLYTVNYNYKIFDFSYVIYYISDKRGVIVIRRMDSEEKYNTEIEIIINDTDKNIKEIIFLEVNSDNKYYFTTTSVNLKELYPQEQKIPKKIFQTGPTNNIKSKLHYNSILSFIDLNPDYEYYYYNDKDGREFIRDNFERNINEAYDILIPGAYKADLLRYCLLYIYGGCYFDCKQILRKSLYNIIKSESNVILCNDIIEDGILNAVMISTAKLDFMIYTIVNCAKNILDKNMSSPLGITGPQFLYNIYNSFYKNKNLKEVNFSLKNYRPEYNKEDYHTDYINNNIKLDNQIILSRFYKGYYDNYLNTIHYGKLFHKGEVYYKNIVYINNYIKILVYPNNNDSFQFNLINNKIIIKNTSNLSWGYDLIILIINLKTCVEERIVVGPSSGQYRDITI